jgi:hypothetical protein
VTGPSAEQRHRCAPIVNEREILDNRNEVLASVDALLDEASKRLGKLSGLTICAAQHIVESAQAIVRYELEPDRQPGCLIALNEARAAVVTATYAVRHIHDATIRCRESRT